MTSRELNSVKENGRVDSAQKVDGGKNTFTEGPNIFSYINGDKVLIDGKLGVEPVLELDSISESTNRLYFPGSIWVKSDLNHPVEITTAGNLYVDGKINAEVTLLVKGMVYTESSVIKAVPTDQEYVDPSEISLNESLRQDEVDEPKYFLKSNATNFEIFNSYGRDLSELSGMHQNSMLLTQSEFFKLRREHIELFNTVVNNIVQLYHDDKFNLENLESLTPERAKQIEEELNFKYGVTNEN